MTDDQREALARCLAEQDHVAWADASRGLQNFYRIRAAGVQEFLANWRPDGPK